MAKAFGRNKIAKYKITPRQFLDLFIHYESEVWGELNQFTGSYSQRLEIVKQDFTSLPYIKNISISVSKEFYEKITERT